MSIRNRSLSESVNNQLKQLAHHDSANGIKSKFTEDSERASSFSYDYQDLFFDFSKTHISEPLIDVYLEVAKELDFKSKRLAFLSGEKINNSEERSVLHTLLRDETNQGIPMSSVEALDEAKNSKTLFIDRYQKIQEQLSKRSVPIKDIIHVGIGGSSLGTQLVFEALKGLETGIAIHFVGNIDGHQLTDVLAKCNVDSTLVIGVSKTFTTAETLQNLDSIVVWFKAHGTDKPLNNFYGVTANPTKASSYGISEENIVSFPNWVGGRYSVWSSVSLSAALVIGMERFSEMLDGASGMDQHFYQAELSENLPYIAASLDHYYTNYLNVKSRAIFAYDFRLRSLVDYLQQLETESNGKDRQRNGEQVDQQTSPVVWGGVGTDVQHSVFQMLHQGTSLIPSEFILVKDADHDLNHHHQELLANGLAQPAALLAGQTYDDVCVRHANEGLSELAKRAKVFSGDRPSTSVLLSRLSPRALGGLLAFYEHRTFCFGVITNINSYDQMGVELGKRLAKQVRPLLSEENDMNGNAESQAQKSADELDSSTLNLLNRILAD